MIHGLWKYKDPNGYEWIWTRDDHQNLMGYTPDEYERKVRTGKAEPAYEKLPDGKDPNKGMN